MRPSFPFLRCSLRHTGTAAISSAHRFFGENQHTVVIPRADGGELRRRVFCGGGKTPALRVKPGYITQPLWLLTLNEPGRRVRQVGQRKAVALQHPNAVGALSRLSPRRPDRLTQGVDVAHLPRSGAIQRCAPVVEVFRIRLLPETPHALVSISVPQRTGQQIFIQPPPDIPGGEAILPGQLKPQRKILIKALRMVLACHTSSA